MYNRGVYQPRTYSFERRLSTEWLVVVHFAMSKPLRALVYLERPDGTVFDVWIGEYVSIRALWTTLLDRVVFGIKST